MNISQTLQFITSFASTVASLVIALFLMNIGDRSDSITFAMVGWFYLLLIPLHIVVAPFGNLTSIEELLLSLVQNANSLANRLLRASKTGEIVNNDEDSNFRVTYENLSIVGIMRLRLTKQVIYKVSLLLWGLAAYVVLLSEYMGIRLSLVVIIATFIVTILLFSYKFVFDFRIQNGFYGNNEREAREIIQFILDEAEDSDFTDNGKLKKIISDDDLYELEKSIKSSWSPEYNRG